MKIKKGDSVIIVSGKDKLKKGKVLKVFPKENKVLIEGLNLRKKHIKPKKSGEKGQTIQVSIPVNSANVKLICPKCSQAARIGYKVVDSAVGHKFRICKKCGQEI
ncbi:MAG: 50S ribosomal protein L24 [Parcubacteria group bacterium CG_4_10_14_0_2_um_filter_7_35_8]|nr:MAG: 50S ribosomal protein L24 [Parcubacteria group bacterium CG10_big_fil_rev_8_21_14_0_10_35_15]PIZ77156.1 MAG: 50S ribosomal protein L24 [Parcubacteria group bacterium CG_4_10_14_0_2_um_filter_7_35_8]